jgi:putative membrane protein
MTATRQRLLVYLIVVIAAVGLTACNRDHTVEAAREDRQQPTGTPAEQDFMMKAAQANMAEIEIARFAMQKSQNSDVKDYANMIQSDHTSALEDLTDLMKEKGVSLPRTLNPETKMDIEKMTALSGADFDREFANMMVADHQKVIEMYRDEANIVENPDVLKYAEDMLPKLEMHLEKGQRLQSRLFGGGRK